MRISTKITISILIYIPLVILATFEVISENIIIFLIFITQSILHFIDSYLYYKKDKKLFMSSLIIACVTMLITITIMLLEIAYH